MRLTAIAAVVFCSWCFAGLAAAQTTAPASAPPADGVSVIFIVQPPTGTPDDAVIYVVGDHPALGNWVPANGLKLTRNPLVNKWMGDITVAPGTDLQYKLTRGPDWDGVEKGPGGEEIRNRTLRVGSKTERVPVGVANWSRGKGRKPTATGDLRLHEKFPSLELKNFRTLRVWLPPDYDKQPDRRYPVLYMHDGQNVFDEATSFSGEWRADETAAKLIAEGRIEPVIIVGIDNTPDRVSEYTPTVDPDEKAGGNARAYARFVVNEVKPFVDQTYRTLRDREHTAVAGSSLGGLVSLLMLREHPAVFSKGAALSPSLWWDQTQFVTSVQPGEPWIGKAKIWLSMGTKEGSTDEKSKARVAEVRQMAGKLRSANRREGRDYVLVVTDEAGHNEHNEAAWSAALPNVLTFLFRPDAPGPATARAAGVGEFPIDAALVADQFEVLRQSRTRGKVRGPAGDEVEAELIEVEVRSAKQVTSTGLGVTLVDATGKEFAGSLLRFNDLVVSLKRGQTAKGTIAIFDDDLPRVAKIKLEPMEPTGR
jgi:predicted alpha/beta superfamily hydrolase